MVEQGIIAALNRIADNLDMWDVVVIIRGGGATSELSCFDTYDLANNCAQFPLPIVTGIGHQRDESILDMVAHTRVKTPTAAAELLVHAMLEQESRLSGIMQDVASVVQRRLEVEWQCLRSLHHRLPLSTTVFMKEESARLKMFSHNLATQTKLLLQGYAHKLDLAQKEIEISSPDRVLAMGYSITRVNGKVVYSVDDLPEGAEVVTSVADGEFRSVVKEKKKN